MSAKAYRMQMADPGFRAELALDGDSVRTPRRGSRHRRRPRSQPQDHWVLRDFRDASGPDRLPGKDFEDEPLIAVLIAHLSGPAADVHAGLALERILLTATVDGLAVSFLSHIVEVEHFREELRRLIR